MRFVINRKYEFCQLNTLTRMTGTKALEMNIGNDIIDNYSQILKFDIHEYIKIVIFRNET